MGKVTQPRMSRGSQQRTARWKLQAWNRGEEKKGGEGKKTVG